MLPLPANSIPIPPGVAISVTNLTRTFPAGTRAIDNLSLEVPPGQFLSILGPSGCGKSTLLRIIANLDGPTAGSLSLAPPPRLAFVFQDAHLLPWRTVLRNVALPLELQHAPKHDRLEAARQILSQVGLSEFAHHYPAQLSGGMKMRVSLARALITQPTLLLMDEPFAALDEITRQRLDTLLRDLWLARRMTVLFVTHSIPEATFLAERALLLTRRPARTVLDHTIGLPESRPSLLRGDPAFARETRLLYQALERAEQGITQ